MNYKIIEPKTVYTVRLSYGYNKDKCHWCPNFLWNGATAYRPYGATAYRPCDMDDCYREFATETEAREWLDKVNEIEKSIDDGLLTATGEKQYLLFHLCYISSARRRTEIE